MLHEKASNIAKSAKYGGYQRELASFVYRFCDKKSVVTYMHTETGFNYGDQ